jgi:hypothetical protein
MNTTTTTTTPKPTPADLRTPEIINAALRVLALKAAAQVKREQVDAIGAELLQAHPLTDSRTGEALTVKDAWRAYGPEWHAWNAACAAEQVRRGVKPADMPAENCPALTLEHEQSKAENALADLSGAPFGVSAHKLIASRDGHNTYRQWLELVTQAALTGPTRRLSLRITTERGDVFPVDFNGTPAEAARHYLGREYVAHECDETGRETRDRFASVEVVGAEGGAL